MVRFTRKRGPAEQQRTADGVRATYARLLDGDHLWLALPVAGGTARLRDRATGQLLSPVNQLADAEPDMICVRWLLVDGCLLGDADAEYDVEWAPATGPARPVLAPPTRPSPTKAPTSLDGRWQFTTTTGDDGRLLLRRTRAARQANLLGIDSEPYGLVVTCRESGPDDTFTLLDADGVRVTDLTTSHQGGRIVATVGAAELTVASAQVGVAGPDGTLPVGRRHNELRNPGAGVVLPTWAAERDSVVLKARFASDATLWIDRTDSGGEGA